MSWEHRQTLGHWDMTATGEIGSDQTIKYKDPIVEGGTVTSQQVLQPIFNPIELGLHETELAQRTGMAVEQVAAALASYVRTIRSGDSDPATRHARAVPHSRQPRALRAAR